MVTIDATKAAAGDKTRSVVADVVDTIVTDPLDLDAGNESSAELDKAAEATRPRRVVWAVPVLAVTMLVIASAILFLVVRGTAVAPSSWTMDWWMVALGFVIAESMIVHLPVERDSHTISMSEIPLVLGLAMASPPALIIGRVIAGAVVLTGRRQSLRKLTFNLALFTLESTVAVAVYRTILGADSPASPRSWLAAMLAIAIAVTFSAALVDIAIAASDRRRELTEIVRSFAAGSLISVGVGFLGTIAVVVLEHEIRAGALLAGAMALFFLFFRTYGSLSRRHADLRSLYSFTNQVDGTLGSRDIAVVTLQEAVSILRAEHGELILSDPTDSHASYLGFSAAEEPAQRRLPLSEVADLFTISLGERSSRIFGPETRDSRLRIALGIDAGCGIISPISHGDGSIGVLVMAGRSGTEKRFDMAELAMLDTVANHASLTLERARVIERLSREITEKRAVIESKDQLIASVSHELRTPLTGVLGFAEMLRTSRSDFTSEETDTMLAAISDDAVDLSNLVEDLLTAARAQTGSLRIAPSPVPLRSVISRVVESTAGSAHHVVVSGASATVLADESRVRQVLRNLITNAQRYGGHQIHVATYVEDTTVFLRVSDNGDGIPESAQERIFAPYESAHDAGTQPASLGLGLTISRSLARLMGGDLIYRRVDGWTTFEFKLQLAPEVPPDDVNLAVELEQI